jgi:hypothetical protein
MSRILHAAEPVCAEQEHGAVRRRADQMEIHAHQAPELIFVAPAEKPDGADLARIPGVVALQVLHV